MMKIVSIVSMLMTVVNLIIVTGIIVSACVLYAMRDASDVMESNIDDIFINSLNLSDEKADIVKSMSSLQGELLVSIELLKDAMILCLVICALVIGCNIGVTMWMRRRIATVSDN